MKLSNFETDQIKLMINYLLIKNNEIFLDGVLICCFSYALVCPFTAFYPASVVVDSVKKAQQEKSASILSRALQMCKDKLVVILLLSNIYQIFNQFLLIFL